MTYHVGTLLNFYAGLTSFQNALGLDVTIWVTGLHSALVRTTKPVDSPDGKRCVLLGELHFFEQQDTEIVPGSGQWGPAWTAEWAHLTLTEIGLMSDGKTPIAIPVPTMTMTRLLTAAQREGTR